MTTTKFGPHGQLVANFLEEIRACDVDWPRFVELSNAPGVGEAITSVGYADWSGTRRSATQMAALDTFKALGLAPSDFGGSLHSSWTRYELDRSTGRSSPRRRERSPLARQ
jgi:hypothetical protein